MRYTSIIIVAISLVAILLTVGIACGGDDSGTGASSDSGPGALPKLYKGDQWEYRAFYGDTEHHLTLTVTDAGKHYTLKMEIDPPLEGFLGETTAKFDKNLLLPVSMEMSGKDPEMGLPFTMESDVSYQISSGKRWPIAVGNEVTITETTEASMDIGGEPWNETETQTATYKVEAVESVTVEAGTFECFKIVKYDESGAKESTSWHSDKVKTHVKEIDHETGEVQELIDYSVR